MRQKRLAKNEITNILNLLALEKSDNEMGLLDKFQYNICLLNLLALEKFDNELGLLDKFQYNIC